MKQKKIWKTHIIMEEGWRERENERERERGMFVTSAVKS